MKLMGKKVDLSLIALCLWMRKDIASFVEGYFVSFHSPVPHASTSPSPTNVSA